jgi:hypothetical protein
MGISVSLYARIGNKKPLAVGIGSQDLLAHGFCFRAKTMTLFRVSEQEKNKNQIGRRWVINLWGERKKIQEWDFLTDQPIGTFSPAAIIRNRVKTIQFSF